jgi:hypothetical protein
MAVGQEKQKEQDWNVNQKFFENLMQEKNRLFKCYIGFLNKKKKNRLSYDCFIKSIFGFLKFKCFWNFSNFKSYFKSFNKQLEQKKNLIDVFYSRYKGFY